MGVAWGKGIVHGNRVNQKYNVITVVLALSLTDVYISYDRIFQHEYGHSIKD
jgi:hypothetical protein